MSTRIINRIARTELATLFYSPIAWLLLAVFAVQIGAAFGSILTEIVAIKAMRTITFSVTNGIVLGARGIYEVIQDSIYLYIPLLTMNLMSREYASGSDKLLYSSPVSSFEIIAGKYLAMLVCSAIFTLILALPAVAVFIMVPQPDVTIILSCLLSMFLLIMTYCAIGLFMSSLTSYQVVAAVATLAALALFNFIGNVGQNSRLIREITYWLSIKGRASEMVGGLICSEDVIYFIAVSAFFLALAVIRLSNQKIRRTFAGKALRYVGAFAALVLVAYVSSRPALMGFIDATQNKARTLAEESQAVMNKLDGGLTITTYVDVFDEEFKNYVPKKQMDDKARFKLYTRFKPEIKMNYVYYWSPVKDTALLNKYPGMSDEQIAREVAALKGYKRGKLYPAEALADRIDLKEEGYQFVRVVQRESGQQARLRLFDDLDHHPSEIEVSAALKKMLQDPVKVAVITGHNERSIKKKGDRDYSIFATSGHFRNAMINQGFDLEEVDLSAGMVPDDFKILLVADPMQAFSENELAAVDSFLVRGGNMMIVTDAGRKDVIDPLLGRFGIELGQTVDEEKTIPARATEAAGKAIGGFFKTMLRNPSTTAVNMPGAASFIIADTSVFKAKTLLETDSLTTAEPEPLALLLSRTTDNADKPQRIIAVADADCFSNSFLQLASRQQTRSFNLNMLPASFRTLCYGEFPVSASRAAYKDTDIHLSPLELPLVKNVYLLLIPLLIAACGAVVLLRRRRR